MKESEIRSQLAQSLELIEPGLELLAEEHTLYMDGVAKGRIDILARDRFSCLVVIELKKSKQTARHALHQLYKYSGLIRQEHKLPQGELRCIIVSTHWEELLLPFSVMTTESNNQWEGYALQTSPNFQIKKIEPIKLQQTSDLCPSHMIYQFLQMEHLQNAKELATEYLQSHGIEDFLMITFNLSPSSIRGQTFSLYVAFDCIGAELQEKLSTRGYTWDKEEPHDLESLVFMNLPTGKAFCEAVISYPERFKEWASTFKNPITHRFGRYKDHLIFSEDTLYKLLGGLDGGSDTDFLGLTSPQRSDHWEHTLKVSWQSISGNIKMTLCWVWAREFIPQLMPKAEVCWNVFNPHNLFRCLLNFSSTRDSCSFPHLEIVANCPKTFHTLTIKAVLVWNGNSPQSPRDILETIYHDHFMLAYGVIDDPNISFEILPSLLTALGLRFRAFYEHHRQKSTKIRDLDIIEDKSAEVKANPGQSLEAFTKNHKWFFDELKTLAMENIFTI